MQIIPFKLEEIINFTLQLSSVKINWDGIALFFVIFLQNPS